MPRHLCAPTGRAAAIAIALIAAVGCEKTEEPHARRDAAPPDTTSQRPSYTSDGQLVAPSPNDYREWVQVGTPLTPNDLNNGAAAFPEFHAVYINPAAWKTYKATGEFPEGTMLVKELLSVGAKQATSGNGYFMGDFTGLEVAIKDSKRYPAEAKGWGYYSFGHEYPLARRAQLNQHASCAQCHVENAAQEMVFTQYYPVLRAAHTTR